MNEGRDAVDNTAEGPAAGSEIEDARSPESRPASAQAPEVETVVHVSGNPAVPQDQLDRLEGLLIGVAERVASLAAQFSQRLAYDEAKDAMIRNLSDEVARYRDDSFRRTLKPHLLDCVGLFDTVDSLLSGRRGDALSDGGDSRHSLEAVHGELLEVLARQDVLPYQDRAERLDPRLHRALKVVKAASPEEHNLICRTVRVGFMWGSQVLRPEEVEVKRFSDPSTEGSE